MNVVDAIVAGLDETEIRPCVSVPCRHLAELLERLEDRPERMLVYPAREAEGLGICAGAYLGGLFPALIIQNSGLGNLVNAYASLDRFFDIPVFFLISHRGGDGERIAAQRPMGALTGELLDLLGVPWSTVDRPDRVGEVVAALREYRESRRSRAVLLPPTFWGGDRATV